MSRADQDAFAVRSQDKAVAAQSNGRLAKEITPVTVPQRKGDAVVVSKDEHPRAGTTVEALAKLPTPFRQGGTVTAGNASGVNDGAAALIVASEAAVKTIRPDANRPHPRRCRRRRAAAHHGHRPGAGDAEAPGQARHEPFSDFDVIELNEAFAAQALAVLRQLGLSDDAEQREPQRRRHRARPSAGRLGRVG